MDLFIHFSFILSLVLTDKIFLLWLSTPNIVLMDLVISLFFLILSD